MGLLATRTKMTSSVGVQMQKAHWKKLFEKNETNLTL